MFVVYYVSLVKAGFKKKKRCPKDFTTLVSAVKAGLKKQKCPKDFTTLVSAVLIHALISAGFSNA